MIWSILHNLAVIFLNGLIISFVFLKTYIFLMLAITVLFYFTKKQLDGIDRIAMKPPHARI